MKRKKQKRVNPSYDFNKRNRHFVEQRRLAIKRRTDETIARVDRLRQQQPSTYDHDNPTLSDRELWTSRRNKYSYK